MPLCRFSKDNNLYDITPVENLFIEEFMLKAPGDFVKVYIYALKLCYHQEEMTLPDFARALGMEEKTVMTAFSYWQRRQLLTQVSEEPLLFELHNVKRRIYDHDFAPLKEHYPYAAFNEQVQAMFGKRLLQPQDYGRIYDWIELLGLPQEVVLMMVAYCLKYKGPRVSLAYMDKVAQTWAQKRINTVSAAESYLQEYELSQGDVMRVLRHIGQRRIPTADELSLYKHWTNDLGFSLDAILFACREMTKISRPNFFYLDKVLTGYAERGEIRIEQMRAHQESQALIEGPLRKLYYELGLRSQSPSPQHMALYRKWQDEWGFGQDAILLAGKQASLSGKKTLASVGTLLSRWQKLGLTTAQEIENHLHQDAHLDADIAAVFERAGITREIGPAERMLFKKWLSDWKFSLEMIFQAAEYSMAAQQPFPFMQRILEMWHDSGIRTLKAAREEHEQRRNQASRQHAPSSHSGMDYDRHEYTPDELYASFVRFDEKEDRP